MYVFTVTTERMRSFGAKTHAKYKKTWTAKRMIRTRCMKNDANSVKIRNERNMNA